MNNPGTILQNVASDLEIGTILQSDAFVKAIDGPYGSHANPWGVDKRIIGDEYTDTLRDETRKTASYIIEFLVGVCGGCRSFPNRMAPSLYTEFFARRMGPNGQYNSKGELIQFDLGGSPTIFRVDISRIKVLGKIEKESEDYKSLVEKIMTTYLGL